MSARASLSLAPLMVLLLAPHAPRPGPFLDPLPSVGSMLSPSTLSSLLVTTSALGVFVAILAASVLLSRLRAGRSSSRARTGGPVCADTPPEAEGGEPSRSGRALDAVRAGVLDLGPRAVGVYLACARLAADHEDWADALLLVRAARKGLPDDAGLASSEGMYLRKVGRLKEAVGAYEEAARLGDPGADVMAALCALESGDVPLALVFVARSLRDVDNLEEIEGEPLLDPLRSEPEFGRLVEEARRRRGSLSP